MHRSTQIGSGHFLEEGFSKSSYYDCKARWGMGIFTEQSNYYDYRMTTTCKRRCALRLEVEELDLEQQELELEQEELWLEVLHELMPIDLEAIELDVLGRKVLRQPGGWSRAGGGGRMLRRRRRLC